MNASRVEIQLNAMKKQIYVLSGVCLLLCLLSIVLATVLPARSFAGEGRLRLRSLAIVDEHGVERMRIAAPLPNPVSGGKESPRRSPAYGIQFNDSNGNEYGGLTISDDGALVHCFDWAQGEATCMFAMPSGEAGFEVKAYQGKTRGQLLLSPNGDISLILNDAGERTRARLRVTAGGKTEILGLKTEATQ